MKLRTSFFIFLLSLSIFNASAQTADPEIWINHQGGPNDSKNGVYALSLTDGTVTPRATDYTYDFNRGMAYQNGYLYGLYHEDAFWWNPEKNYLYRINTHTWQVELINLGASHALFADKTASSFDGTVYAVYNNNLLTFDYTTYTSHSFGTTNRNYIALGVSGLNELYGIADDGKLVRINTQTGAETVVGDTHLNVRFSGTTGTIDPVSNQFYIICRDSYYGEPELFAVSLTDATSTKKGKVPSGYYFRDMVILGEPAAKGAPAQAYDLKALFADDSLEGTFTFTIPTVTFDGEKLEGEVGYTVTYTTGDGDKQTITGTSEAGATVELPIVLTSSGEITFTVKLANSAGEGQTAELVQWIGPDAPANPTNAHLTVNSEGVASVIWTAPTKGIHGTILRQLTYDVYRVISGERSLAAQDITETSFTEQLSITTLKDYYYIIVAKNGSSKSEEVKTNSLVLGEGFGIPFYEDFGEDNKLPYFTIINVNGDSYKVGALELECTWTNATYSYIGIGTEPRMRCLTDQATDDWLITPPLQMQPGTIYQLSFNMAAGSETPERFEIMMGREATVEGMTTMLIPEKTITGVVPQTFTKEFSVSEAGTYCIGFHATPNLGMVLYLDDISVTVGASQEAPDSVKNVRIITDPTGKLQATLHFDAPAVTIGGSPLNEITKIEIERNGELIATIEDATPGKSVEYIDNTPRRGFNNYRITAFNAEGKGLSRETEDYYIGIDTPLPPVVKKVVDNGESVTFEWEAVSDKGVHGCPVDPKGVNYLIYDNAISVVPIGVVSGCSYTATFNTNNGKPDMHKWLIVAQNMAGMSDAAAAKVATGEPYYLPYRETFAMGKVKTMMWTEQTGVRSFNASIEDAAGTDAGSMLFLPYRDGDASSLNLCRLSLEGARTAVMTFLHKGIVGSNAVINVNVWEPNGEVTTLATIADGATANLQGSSVNEGWTREKVDLSAFIGKPFIVVKLEAVGEADMPVFIDDIMIDDIYEKDLDITMQTPAMVKAGETIPATVTVVNKGEMDVASYTVNLFVNGLLWESRQATEPLASFAEKDFTFDVPTDDSHPVVSIKAEVTTPLDMDESNNTCLAAVNVQGASGIIRPDTSAQPATSYDLQGRPLEGGARPAIRIINGKKIVVK